MVEQSPPSGGSARRPIGAPHADCPGILSGVILAAGAFAAYSRTFSVPLIYDDNQSIGANPSIRGLWPTWRVLSPPDGTGVAGRPLLNLSYALNYAFGGTAVVGYHLVNLLIHVLAAWTLFALARRTLRRPVLAGRFGPVATPLALAVSAIWAWHPVQTESVTYLSQRAESLMGLFYLLTLYCFLRGAEAAGRGRGRAWFSLSAVACLAGVGVKEVIVTAPLIVLLYDRTFVSGSFSAALRRHWRPHLALAATWLPLGCLMIGLQHRGVGFDEGAAWWAYGMTECRVVVRYLLLAFWPHPLVFDYGMFAPVRLPEVWPQALVLASLLTATVIALRRWPAAGFMAAWFFLILAPASSIVSIAWQPMAENRLYLPLAGVAACAVLGAFALAGRWSLPVLALVAAGLGLATSRRNHDYSSAQAIWGDTVAKRPENYRARNNLGDALSNAPGRWIDAIAQYEEALRLKPDFAEAHSNLGAALLNVPGRLHDAIAQDEEALRLDPGLAGAHINLGNALSSVPGRLNDAVEQYGEALSLNPDSAEAHNGLGSALAGMPGRLNDAVAQFEEALRLNPDFAEALFNLGNALCAEGRTPEAIARLEEALRLKPDFAEAHYVLGNAWLRIPGRLTDAVTQYEEALRLRPDYGEALANLGYALNSEGRTHEAVARFEAALRLRPDSAEALINLGNALNADGRPREAIARFEEALRLRPDLAEAHLILGNALSDAPGRLTDAIAQYEAALHWKPNLAEAHLGLAVALLKLPGHGDEARAHLEACLRLEPDNAPARQVLANIRAPQP